MQKQNDLAKNLLNLFEASSYKEFQEGFFKNKPKMRGYYYIFKRLTKPKFCLIINTSNEKYPAKTTLIRDYVFMVFNTPSLEEFLQNLTEKYFTSIMEILENNVQKKNKRNLPVGYYTDENGDLKIDLKVAMKVRRVYDMYLDDHSIRDIAEKLNTNFSDIREILYQGREYMNMSKKIVPLSKLKQAIEKMALNAKGGAVATKSIEDQVADARRRRKQNQRRIKQLRGETY